MVRCICTQASQLNLRGIDRFRITVLMKCHDGVDLFTNRFSAPAGFQLVGLPPRSRPQITRLYLLFYSS